MICKRSRSSRTGDRQDSSLKLIYVQHSQSKKTHSVLSISLLQDDNVMSSSLKSVRSCYTCNPLSMIVWHLAYKWSHRPTMLPPTTMIFSDSEARRGLMVNWPGILGVMLIDWTLSSTLRYVEHIGCWSPVGTHINRKCHGSTGIYQIKPASYTTTWGFCGITLDKRHPRVRVRVVIWPESQHVSGCWCRAAKLIVIDDVRTVVSTYICIIPSPNDSNAHGNNLEQCCYYSRHPVICMIPHREPLAKAVG